MENDLSFLNKKMFVNAIVCGHSVLQYFQKVIGIVGFHNKIDFVAYTLLWQIRHFSTKNNEVVSSD